MSLSFLVQTLKSYKRATNMQLTFKVILNNCFKFGNHKMSSDLIMLCDTERFCIKFDKFYHLRKIKTLPKQE